MRSGGEENIFNFKQFSFYNAPSLKLLLVAVSVCLSESWSMIISRDTSTVDDCTAKLNSFTAGGNVDNCVLQ